MQVLGCRVYLEDAWVFAQAPCLSCLGCVKAPLTDLLGFAQGLLQGVGFMYIGFMAKGFMGFNRVV